ncbi:LuxR C-terminal-related transcriptional regulator [Plebeiibacterium marinum]|uniref:LuxR C-terminal-related transcriptional regulator n=1 Tax=Plebeiibacterium marinum TaxID=2992111 RepID=A0AAE3MGZ2_9BACT|nr:LuxR C-terminal-related transcriptional regulator [Plebeiobacterium marinum]MCW3807798.1 LuxR C-terminal-related transcriptional regulator [Plebeiobacterium marinum]
MNNQSLLYNEINTLDDVSLEAKISFYEEILNSMPASVHVTQIDENLNTLPLWVNKTFEKIIGFNLKERQKYGYAGSNGHFYHPDDIYSIKNNIRYLIENPHIPFGSIVFRIKTASNSYKWIYMIGKVFKKTSVGYQFLCVAIDIDDRLAFNNREMNIYLKEISRLTNQVKLSKLTKTERKTIALFGKGFSTKEVASKLNRSYETINNHKRNIFKKLGFHKITELVSFAEICGL